VHRLLALVVVCYVATGQVTRVLDGSTFEATLRVWHNITVHEKVRVFGIVTPERSGKSMELGVLATAFTRNWLERGDFHVRTCGRNADGYIWGIITRDGHMLSRDLISEGHATPQKFGD